MAAIALDRRLARAEECYAHALAGVTDAQCKQPLAANWGTVPAMLPKHEIQQFDGPPPLCFVPEPCREMHIVGKGSLHLGSLDAVL